MATERQAPDALSVQTNLTGSLADIDDDPDSPDGNWLTATTDGQATTMRVTFPTPTGNPTTGAGLQEFRVQCRQTNNPGGSDPSYSLELYENGGQVSVLATGTISSSTGEVISGTWDATSLGTADGSLVECYLAGTVNKKDSVEIGAVEWNVDYTAGGPVEELAGSVTGSAASTGDMSRARGFAGEATGSAASTGDLSTDRGFTGTAAGSAASTAALTRVHPLAGSVTGSATATGALSRVYTVAASATASAAIDGVLDRARDLTGTSTGAAASTGALSVTLALAASATGAATADGVLGKGVGLSGSCTGSATVTGDISLGSTHELTGTCSGAATSTADLIATWDLTGTAAGSGAVAAALARARDLTGTCTGAATSTGDLTVTASGTVHELTGTATGAAASTGDLTLAYSLCGTAAGAAAATGDLTVSSGAQLTAPYGDVFLTEEPPKDANGVYTTVYAALYLGTGIWHCLATTDQFNTYHTTADTFDTLSSSHKDNDTPAHVFGSAVVAPAGRWGPTDTEPS